MEIALFTTCLGDLFAQEAVVSTARVLRRLGHRLHLPPQTCCGQPAMNSGFPGEAKPFIAAYLRDFLGAQAVVAPSGSCVAMLRHGLRQFFPEDPEALALAERTYELTQFLTDVEGLDRPQGRYAGRAIYHESCHLAHWLHQAGRAERLFSGIAGLELLHFPDPQLCCGFGGTFAVHFEELSLAMADEKVAQLPSQAPDLLVASDQGCLMQLGGRLEALGRKIEPMHVAVLLDRAGVGE
ncbi:MAG: (Fe-S)-binding protein [Thermaerobacter sp.]|nr:(Fe-S)-binding protein [Thermaerobacter sp.]